MKSFFSSLFFVLILLFACNSEQQVELREAEGDRFYGGVFNYNETEYFKSLYPLNVTEVVGHRLVTQIYEGLVRFDNGDVNNLIPTLAEYWDVDSTGTVYVFKIREGVFFHDDPCFPDGKGREITAHDFVYCLTKACEADDMNQGFNFYKDLILGAEDYYNASKSGDDPAEGLEGVRALDDFTLEIRLVKPYASFLYRLALPFAAVFPREAVEKYGTDKMNTEKCVGTGPFYIAQLMPDQEVILQRNPSYWGDDEFGNQLPYLDGIRIQFIKEDKNVLSEFKKGSLDLKYRLPLELIPEVLTPEGKLTEAYSSYQLQEISEFTLQYYGFQTKDELFGNMDVRKAFNYAIDREAIVDFTLKGQGYPANYGVVPLGFRNYPNESVEGYTFDPDKARAHMDAAGFPNGEGFPEITLQINEGGGRNTSIAEAIKKMLEDNLNITIVLTKKPFKQHLTEIETGYVNFWRLGWVADYPLPETFLELFYGKHVPENLHDRSYINSTRYQNPVYDSLYEEAIQTMDEMERNMLYSQLDQIAIGDAAILPIYYSKNIRLLQPNVRNLPQNPMEYRNLREVYFVPE